MYNKLSKLEAHSGTEVHLTSKARWNGYKSEKLHGNVHTQLLSNHEKLVESNRKYIKIIIDIVIHLAFQGLAYRGHDESKTFLYKGNN
jgi:hypothetical protein